MRSEHCIDTIRPPSYRPLRVDVAAATWFAARRLGYHLGRGCDRLLGWAERARERHRLAELNDHMLRDIGLSRVDVMAEATKPFWRS
jgi:uncharacterized protein YjiS (DUF1127 family)